MSRALKQFYGPERGDNLLTATAAGEQSALSAGYFLVRTEGYALSGSESGTMPLKLYWNSFRGDNYTTATLAGEQSALDAGYVFIRNEGYVHAAAKEGLVPLKLFWSPERADNFVTASVLGEQDAKNAGYRFIRVEGYVSPMATGIDIDLASDLGAGHVMETHGVLLKREGRIDATTRTRTGTLLGGFHGGVQIFLADANGHVIGVTTDRHVFGVDGTLIGRSDRTDFWSEGLDRDIASRTESIHVVHFWEQRYTAITNIINSAVDAAGPVIDLLKEIKSSGPEADGK